MLPSANNWEGGTPPDFEVNEEEATPYCEVSINDLRQNGRKLLELGADDFGAVEGGRSYTRMEIYDALHAKAIWNQVAEFLGTDPTMATNEIDVLLDFMDEGNLKTTLQIQAIALRTHQKTQN